MSMTKSVSNSFDIHAWCFLSVHNPFLVLSLTGSENERKIFGLFIIWIVEIVQLTSWQGFDGRSFTFCYFLAQVLREGKSHRKFPFLSFMSQDLITKGYFGSWLWLQISECSDERNNLKSFVLSPFACSSCKEILWQTKSNLLGKISIVLYVNFLIFKCPSF